MDFRTLHKKISPRLKAIAYKTAKSHNWYNGVIDNNDLYQEMNMHLWNNFKNGVPEGMNYSYISRGCEFHILNFLRKNRVKARIISIDKPINEHGDTLKEVLPSSQVSLKVKIDRDITIQQIQNNGFTPKEKKVFSLLLSGHTVREAGRQLGISHVMVVKHKKRLIEKWQKKKNKSYQRDSKVTLVVEG